MMVRILLIILLAVFALKGFIDGDFKITQKRIVNGYACQLLEVILVVGAGLSLLYDTAYGLIALLIAIIVGLATSKPLEA